MFSLCVIYCVYCVLQQLVVASRGVCSKLKLKESFQFMGLSLILVQKGSCLLDEFPDRE